MVLVRNNEMTDERKQELRQMLQEAMKCLEIQTSEMYKPITIDRYRECLQEFRKAYRPELSSILYYHPYVKNDLIKSRLLDFLKYELGEYISETNWVHPARTAIRSNDLYYGCPLSTLLEKLLEIAIAGGVDKAISALDKCTKETKGSFQKIIFIQGLTCNPKEINEIEETHISEGIRLVTFPFQLPDLPTFLYDERFSPISRSASPMNFQLRTLLIIDYSVSPLFCKPTGNEDEEFNPFHIGIKSTEFPNFNVEKYCQALSLSTNCVAEPIFEWNYIDEDELFNLRGGIPVEICNLNIPHDKPKMVRITETHIEKAKVIYKTLTSITSNIKGNLQIPIDRWIKSKTNKSNVDKMIDLGVAFEGLYLSEGRREQLTLQFRLRAAWYLGKDKEDRKRLMDEFKTIYDWRSAAVHTGKLPKKTRNTPEKVEAFITYAQNLCRDSIMKILEDGKFPDWNELILGEESS